MPKQTQDRIFHLASAVCSETEYNAIILQDRHKTAQAGLKLFRVFCNGFVRCSQPIQVLCKRPTSRRKSGRLYIPAKDEVAEGVRYHYMRTFNLPVIGNAYALLGAFCHFLSPRRCHKNDLVFVDPLNVCLCIGTVAACKLRRIPTVAFITDVPDFYAYGTGGKPSLFQRLSNFIREQCDGFIFVTEQINNVCNRKNRPYMVLEGFVNEDLRHIRMPLEEKYTKKVCMYTGGMETMYGLDMLVEGFLKADLPDSELHLYGAGNYVSTIEERANQDPRIRYFGCRENAYVVREQMKATLLINPRYSHKEYTKYSFPGKNLEYAASGTPTLTTPLPGMPREYYPHVYVLEEETVDGMAATLRRILSQDAATLYAFGQATKEWMLNNKNNRTQIQKVIDFTQQHF